MKEFCTFLLQKRINMRSKEGFSKHLIIHTALAHLIIHIQAPIENI